MIEIALNLSGADLYGDFSSGFVAVEHDWGSNVKQSKAVKGNGGDF